jgi:ketosteroid isomerase-like protein
MTKSTIEHQNKRRQNTIDNESQIRELVENWTRAARKEDMSGVLAHHADDIVNSSLTTGHLRLGRMLTG